MNKKLMISTLLVAVVAGLWFAVGPRVFASVSHMSYAEELFGYQVEFDEVFNEETKQVENDGILVAIQPEYDVNNASAFSDAYIAASDAQALLWSQTRLGAEKLDVMLVFSEPLSMDAVNEMLMGAEAAVFESGAVGYGADGIPFAVYSTEYQST